MTKKIIKTRDDYALGLADKNGKRNGGFFKMLMVMRQNQEKIASGELSEEELLESAYRMADQQIAKNMAGPDEEPQTFNESDQEYRDDQEARYREAYEWNDTNDEAALQMLLDLEVQQKVLNREFARANMSVKDRTDLLGELRNIAKDHSALQKQLGIDRVSRDSKKRTGDPMENFQNIIADGERKMLELMEEWPTVAAGINDLETLRAMAKHHLGLGMQGYQLLDPLLDAHRRIIMPTASSAVVV